MKTYPPFRPGRTRTLAAVLAFAVVATLPVSADDREIFRNSADEPYVFILFAATGSMEVELKGDIKSPRADDAPDTRMYQAKLALETVLRGIRDKGERVNFGFATFPDQDGHYAYTKKFNKNGAFIVDRQTTSHWCNGIEVNNDRPEDEYSGYTYKWPTSTTSSGLSIGDIVPLDWDNNNLETIRRRLAPNLALGETTPDFGIARYFEDSHCIEIDDDDATETCGPPNGLYLRLRDPRARPFMAQGHRPLQGALDSFETWFRAWEVKARAGDPAYARGCKKVHIVMLTDGFENCRGTPTTPASRLLRQGIKTHVIGFAVQNKELDAIAVAGGTDASPAEDGSVYPEDPEHEAYFARDAAGLVDAFEAIFEEILKQSRTFATAASPSVVGPSSQDTVLTSFSPIGDGTSTWPGRVDGYIKPVPMTTNALGQEVPNRNKVCSGPNDESCLAWDAARILADQAPTESDVLNDVYKVGNAQTDRRVFYAKRATGEVPLQRRFFLPPADSVDQVDLYGPLGMQLDISDPMYVEKGRDVVRYVLKKKTVDALDPVSGVEEPTEFVLGDIFHSDPVILGEPSRFSYFATDLEGQTAPCDSTNNQRDRYPCFMRDHLYRRRVVFVGTNEGQLHAFETGRPWKNADGTVGFSNGSGKELFSFIPRGVMPSLVTMKEGSGHQYTVDATVTVDDVIIDSKSTSSDPPSLKDREWRTVLIGGQREGGRSYYALDVTQPDPVDSNSGLPVISSQVPGCINGGKGCGPVPYASVLWEFNDVWDEDGDNPGAPDLGDTWSRVNVGRIRVTEGKDTVDKYVAIFGGGLDAAFLRESLDPATGVLKPYSGNYLYMVDIETGMIIYKRRLDLVNGVREPAMVPSEPAAVDVDQDSYIDTIYIGTTGGYLFKVDVSDPVSIDSDVKIRDYSSIDPATGRPPLVRPVDRIVDAKWEPVPIFDTGARPIYFPPSVIFVSELASYALAWGTGDREDLWRDLPVDGRFFVLLDDALGSDTSILPLDESMLELIDAGASKKASPQGNLLTDPDSSEGKIPGWVLALDPNERAVAKSFGLAGVLFFNTYLPTLEDNSGVCSSAGSSRLYSVFATNGLGLRSTGKRYKEVADFVTRPFVEASGGSKRTDGSGGSVPPPDQCDSEELAAMSESIKSLMPAECKFASYRLNVMTLESQSGLECLVPIPVCVIERNWKEF